MGKLLTSTIQRNWHNIANEATLSIIWPSKPLSANIKSRNIYSYLVHSAQTYGPSQQNYSHHYPQTPTYTNCSHAFSDIPMTIWPQQLHLVPLQHQSQPSNRVTKNRWKNIMTCDNNLDITQWVHGVPMLQPSCGLLRQFGYALLIKVFWLHNIVTHSLCNHVIFSHPECQTNSKLQILPSLIFVLDGFDK